MGLDGDLSQVYYTMWMQPICSTGAKCCEWWPFSASCPADQDVLSGGNASGNINFSAIVSILLSTDEPPYTCGKAVYFTTTIRGTIFRIYWLCKLQVHCRYGTSTDCNHYIDPMANMTSTSQDIPQNVLQQIAIITTGHRILCRRIFSVAHGELSVRQHRNIMIMKTILAHF